MFLGSNVIFERLSEIKSLWGRMTRSTSLQTGVTFPRLNSIVNMPNTVQDLRYAVRTLSKSPLLVGVAVLSLALGIGANTAIFTLIDQLLLRMLPVKNP